MIVLGGTGSLFRRRSPEILRSALNYQKHHSPAKNTADSTLDVGRGPRRRLDGDLGDEGDDREPPSQSESDSTWSIHKPEGRSLLRIRSWSVPTLYFLPGALAM